jgi:hypothetical protein
MGDTKHTPGEFPEVRDEAPPTPMWIPMLGLGLLALLTVSAVYRSATATDEPVEGSIAPAEDVADDEGGDEGAADAPSPAPAPAPAPAAVPVAPPGGGGGGGAAPDSFGRNPGDEHFGHDHP